ncbi:MAG TPA: hypothetical protein VM511_06880 [Luteolibacter sp.]|nr:hypothetical protein [Luteolibacter sp.]
MDLTLADFVLFLLLGSFGLIVFFTVISRMNRNGSECRSISRRVICRLCLHAFETSSREKTVDCPHCGVANERRGGHRPG